MQMAPRLCAQAEADLVAEHLAAKVGAIPGAVGPLLAQAGLPGLLVQHHEVEEAAGK